MPNFTREEVESLRSDFIVARAVAQMMNLIPMLNGLGALPADSRSGGHEDINGNWIEYFKAGDKVASKPIRPSA